MALMTKSVFLSSFCALHWLLYVSFPLHQPRITLMSWFILVWSSLLSVASRCLSLTSSALCRTHVLSIFLSSYLLWMLSFWAQGWYHDRFGIISIWFSLCVWARCKHHDRFQCICHVLILSILVRFWYHDHFRFICNGFIPSCEQDVSVMIGVTWFVMCMHSPARMKFVVWKLSHKIWFRKKSLVCTLTVAEIGCLQFVPAQYWWQREGLKPVHFALRYCIRKVLRTNSIGGSERNWLQCVAWRVMVAQRGWPHDFVFTSTRADRVWHQNIVLTVMKAERGWLLVFVSYLIGSARVDWYEVRERDCRISLCWHHRVDDP